jgi:hypothetical protein
MRHRMCMLLGVVIVGCTCCQSSAAESGSRWWPFGKNKDAGANTTVVQPGEAPITPEVLTSQSSVAQQTAAPLQSRYSQQTPGPSTPITPEPERSWMINSPLAKVSWPRLHLPEMRKPTLPPSPLPKRAEVDAARNAWVEEDPNAAEPSPLQAVKNGAGRVKQSTKNAWDKTVDVFTPGDSTTVAPSSRVARGEKRSFWKRMFVEEPQTESPQTITEWMAQDRLDP